jgi:hypothetical protein
MRATRGKMTRYRRSTLAVPVLMPALMQVLMPVLALVAALAVLAVPAGGAFAQNPFMPKMSLGGKDEKKPLTPEEQERQKRLDDAYKAATNKIPDKTPNDPWAGVRPAPPAPAPKKKQQ